MVSVVMGQDTKVKRRQLLDVDCGIGETFGGESVTEMGMITSMQEVGIRQNRKVSIAQDDGRCPHEKDRPPCGLKIQGLRSGQIDLLNSRHRTSKNRYSEYLRSEAVMR